jgi:hypothetical protein
MSRIRSLLIEAANTSKTRDVALDLSSTVKGIEKLCVQTPYVTQELFEKKVGQEVSNFSNTMEEAFFMGFFEFRKRASAN